MNKFLVVPFVCMFFFVSLSCQAETGGCVPGPCQKEDHLEHSRSYAGTVFVATFSFSKYEKNFHRKDNLIKVDVNIERMLRQSDPLASKITFSISDSKAFVFTKKSGEDDIRKEFGEIIADDDIDLIRKKYESYEGKFSLESAHKNTSSANFAIVRVNPGSLDSSVKDAFIPVFEGEKYVVFLYHDYLVDGQLVSPWELNLYPYEIYKDIYKDKPIVINK